MRTLLLLAAVPALLLGGHAVAAPSTSAPTPFAGEVRTASTTFELGGRDGRTWLVDVTLDETHPVQGPATDALTVSLRACTVDKLKKVHCSAPVPYRAALTSGGIAADLSSARVVGTFAGSRIDVSWVVDAAGSYDALASVDTDAGQVEVRHAQAGGSGPVVGIVLGPRCKASGSVGGGYVVRRDGPPTRSARPAPARLPSPLVPTSHWTPRCV